MGGMGVEGDKGAEMSGLEAVSEVGLRTRTEFGLARMIILMAAYGHEVKEIAEKLQVKDSRVRMILKSESAQNEIVRMQDEMYADSDRAFKRLLPKAIKTTAEIMESGSEKGATRLMAANVVMDRVLGKPVQQINHEGGALRELYERLDAKKALEVSGRPIEDAVLVPESSESTADTRGEAEGDWMAKAVEELKSGS